MTRLGRGVLALAVLLALASCSREVEAPPVEAARTPTAEDLRYGPLQVVVGVGPGLTAGAPWTMFVEPSGRSAVFLPPRMRDAKYGDREAEVRTLDLGREGRERIREALIAERFFELEPVYGRPATDHAVTFIDARIGECSHRVEIEYTHRDEIRDGRAAGTLEGLERAWRVFDAITEPIEEDFGAARTRACMELRGQDTRFR